MTKTVEDKQKVIDLLCRKFGLNRTEKNPREVSIYWSDLKRNELTPEDFGEIIYLLEKDGGIKLLQNYDEDLVTSHFNSIQLGIEEEEPCCFKVEVPKNFDSICQSVFGVSINTKAQQKGRVHFDGRVLKYNNLLYSFQTRSGDGSLSLRIFKELWNKGTAMQSGQLAVLSGLIVNASAFEKNKEKKTKLKNIIKSINKNLKLKGIPARINYRSGTVLLKRR